MAIVFVSTGKSLGSQHYDLTVDGTKIGYATAKVSRPTTGLQRVRGTTYEANVSGRYYTGSRKTVVREIERALAAKSE